MRLKKTISQRKIIRDKKTKATVKARYSKAF